jgi:hypothetical protein
MDEEIKYIDARDGFLDLYRSVVAYKNKSSISLDEYHYIHEAIEFAREALHHLARMEAEGNGSYAHERDSLHKRLDELNRIKGYFEKEKKVVYKHIAKKMRRPRKNKGIIEDFYNMRHWFLEKYARALILKRKNMITITEYSDLEETIYFGKRVLQCSFPATQGNAKKRFLEDRIDFISRVSEVYRISRHFWKNCKVAVDYEWVNMD